MIWNKQGKISQNKFWELQISRYAWNWLEIQIDLNWRQTDHAGPWIMINILGWQFDARIYDHRHWDDQLNNWGSWRKEGRIMLYRALLFVATAAAGVAVVFKSVPALVVALIVGLFALYQKGIEWRSILVNGCLISNGASSACFAIVDMKHKIYWRTMSPWIIVPAVLVVTPFIVTYMWIRHPRRCWRLWRQSRGIF